MSLVFDRSDAIYDSYRQIIIFMAADGLTPVQCCVTSDALRTKTQSQLTSGKQMLETYAVHAETIHEIVARKYQSRTVDDDGSVLVLQRDLQAR